MPLPLEPTEADRELIGKVATMLARRRLATPATMVLEMARPLNFVASQFMAFMNPFATMVLKPEEYERFTQILEHREAVDVLIAAIANADRSVGPPDTNAEHEQHE